MFEKDIYQLIRGLRSHKGHEREYIQQSLQECRKEIRGSDMDQKATALLKLVYLEMFGHDMSWASFNVLEVMSSAKYLQKRVGYLAAVQSFRSDTEVLMLAENLLKKDINSPDKPTMSLPLVTIPHVINPGMANSLLTDLLPRLSHSSPAIRKKTIVTLYRLALVYPETLRPAWPKIKERLLDENEDSSVTAAIVNVVCELGWRRPQDFLPLAPRLFELLTAGGNNWMAIKIIKLFSTLIPLEPRLVKKLLPPLTQIIKTTPAMSLLYECINGIIQGGIMEAAGGTTEGDEVARLCVTKLRAMLVVEGDPNLRYVALLAFAKITSSHADVVAEHSDVILECIDDADISIRTRALDLIVDMINANNLQTVVERLLKQLRTAGVASAADDPINERPNPEGIVPMADDDDDEMQANIKKRAAKSTQAPPLPDDYRSSVIERILDMCSRNTYANMNDFEWYIGILVDLVKQCPSAPPAGNFGTHPEGSTHDQPTMADAIGNELLNVAVRVKGIRPEAAAAAQSLLFLDHREQLFPVAGNGGEGVLSPAAFIAGEYASLLPDRGAVITSMLQSATAQLPANTLSTYLSAIIKIFASMTSGQDGFWTESRKSTTSLLVARIVHFLEPLTLHPSLEVQERAVEYLELMRLASEATSSQPVGEGYNEPPLLLTRAIPSLFSGTELNPVAPAALRRVPLPEDLDLDAPINENLQSILQQATFDATLDETVSEVHRFYHEKPSKVIISSKPTAASDLLDAPTTSTRSSSYQNAETDILHAEAHERKKAERRERYKDDPYYIDSDRASGTSTPMHNILRNSNGEELDVDAIPVMELKLDNLNPTSPDRSKPKAIPSQKKKKPKRHFEIAADETLGVDSDVPSLSSSPASRPLSSIGQRPKKSLLGMDTSGLSSFSLNDNSTSLSVPLHNSNGKSSKLDIERKQQEEDDMARAIKEVERLRLEMQRNQERIVEREDLPEDGTVVKRKKKKKTTKGDGVGGEGSGAAADEGVVGDEDAVTKKKKKKKKVRDGLDVLVTEENTPLQSGDGGEGQEEEGGGGGVVKVKRKKKRSAAVPVADEN